MGVARYRTFREFYPYYLSEHSDRNCRRLHFTGITLAIACLLAALATLNAWWLLAALTAGYGLGWAGHYFYEKNSPTTLIHPFYSFAGDWMMCWEILTGKIRL